MGRGAGPGEELMVIIYLTFGLAALVLIPTVAALLFIIGLAQVTNAIARSEMEETDGQE